jgi:uncharacterized protein YydD (DUF2326 family)
VTTGAGDIGDAIPVEYATKQDIHELRGEIAAVRVHADDVSREAGRLQTLLAVSEAENARLRNLERLHEDARLIAENQLVRYHEAIAEFEKWLLAQRDSRATTTIGMIQAQLHKFIEGDKT